MTVRQRHACETARRHRLRVYLAYLPLLIMLALWLWLTAEMFILYGSSRFGVTGALGSDFAMFYSAAHVLAAGHNPYDPISLYQVDIATTRHAGLPDFSFAPLVRVGNPPLFFWMLRPLAALPYRTALYAWIGLLIAMLVVGFLAGLRALGWKHPLACLLFLLAPQTQIGLRSGNVIPLVFAGIGLALLLSARNRPRAAGLALCLVWLKPQVGLPIAALIIMFHAQSPRRALEGFLGGTLAGLALTAIVMGPLLLIWWLRSFTGYSGSIAIQGDLASLAGIYYRWAPADLRTGFEVVTVVAALGLTAFVWWRTRDTRPVLPAAIGWLWFAWLLASPYDHFDDQILLAIPVLALLGANGRRIGSPLSAITLYAMFLCVLPFNASLPQMQLIWLPTTVACLCMVLVGRAFSASSALTPEAGPLYQQAASTPAGIASSTASSAS